MNIEAVMSSFLFSWSHLAPVILKIIVGLTLLLIGYLIAKAIGWAVAAGLKLVQLDKGLKQIGFNSLLERGEIKKNPADLVGDGFYWVILFITVIGISRTIGLPIEPALARIFRYLGVALLTAIILGVGLFFASVVASLVKLVALNSGIEGAKSLSRVIYYLVIILIFVAALSQIGISAKLFVLKFDVIIGAVGLAAAIAFGLGCKDMAADFLHNLFKGK